LFLRVSNTKLAKTIAIQVLHVIRQRAREVGARDRHSREVGEASRP